MTLDKNYTFLAPYKSDSYTFPFHPFYLSSNFPSYLIFPALSI